MKKITILALHLSFGGIEKCISSLVNILHNNFEIEIISLYKVNDIPTFPIPDNVKVKYLMKYKSNRHEFWDLLKQFKLFATFKEGLKSTKILITKNRLMKKAISESKSDIIISTRSEISLLLAKSKRKDVIKIAHEHVYHNNNSSYIRNIGRILEGVDYLLPSSEYLRKFYSEKYNMYSDKIKYLKWPIDLVKEEVSDLITKNIVSTGRLSPEKKYDDLLDIFSVVNKMHEDWTLTIIGDGALKNKLMDKSKYLKIDDKVIFTGWLNHEEINKIYNKSSIYVMTSKFESFGLVLLEAGIMGLPLIAFESALGAKEILDDKNYGILIENRSKNKMIKEINDLIENKSKRQKLGNKAHERASSYLFDNVKKEHLEFYHNLEDRN